MAGDSRGVGRISTSTSDFGISGRESHDSSKYYQSKINQNQISFREVGELQDYPSELINKIVCEDSRKLSFLPDNCVHLMITSPPYNACKEYDDDLSLNEYLGLLKDVFKETYRVLVPGGRAAINIANLGRKPYIPLSTYINQIMKDGLEIEQNSNQILEFTKEVKIIDEDKKVRIIETLWRIIFSNKVASESKSIGNKGV